MNNNITNIKKIEELSGRLCEEIEAYCHAHTSRDIYYDDGCLTFALMDSFYGVVSYLPDYYDDEDLANIPYGEGYEIKTIPLDEVVGFFDTHTLHDCAKTFLSFNHPEKFDPFGFAGFSQQAETLIAVIREIQRRETNNKEVR